MISSFQLNDFQHSLKHEHLDLKPSWEEFLVANHLQKPMKFEKNMIYVTTSSWTRFEEDINQGLHMLIEK